MMIIASNTPYANRGDYSLGVRIDRKEDLLSFMESFDFAGVAPGIIEDLSDGSLVSGLDFCLYEFRDLSWTSMDIYNLRKNDLELNPEFVKAALGYFDSGAVSDVTE